MSANSITLAGGGLVGSLLSLILARKGYQVEVFESRPDMRKVDISAGRSINLALANRGIRPLEALGLMPQIYDMIIPMKGRMVHVDNEPSVLQPYGQQEHEVIYSISRGQLNSFLMDEAEKTGRVNFHFEHKVSAVDFAGNTITLEHKGDSITRDFTRLIGTDGSNSVVRDAILAEYPDKQLSIDVLDHSYKELHISPDEMGKHKIDKQALHIWPRSQFMLIALPNLDGSFTVTLFLHTQGDISFESLQGEESIELFFNQYFSDIKPDLENLIETFKSNPTGRLATVKCAPWNFADKGLIIGDAAHAVVPFHGQGMNCGFEDCQAVAELIPDAADADNADWHAILESIAKQRKPNGDAIADMAIENYVEMRDSVIQPEFLRKKAFGFKLQQWFPERFTPRYGMVMFEHRPYSEAFQLGKIHNELLSDLSANFEAVETLSKEQAEQYLNKYAL